MDAVVLGCAGGPPVERAQGARVETGVEVGRQEAHDGDGEPLAQEQQVDEQLDQREVLAADREQPIDHDVDVHVVQGPRIRQARHEAARQNHRVVRAVDKGNHQGNHSHAEEHVEHVVQALTAHLQLRGPRVQRVELQHGGHWLRVQNKRGSERSPDLNMLENLQEVVVNILVRGRRESGQHLDHDHRGDKVPAHGRDVPQSPFEF